MELASNPTVVTVVPRVRIDRAAGRNGVVTIRGSGFGGYAKRSGTAVRGRFRTVQGGRVTIQYVNGTISSWDDGRIVVRWSSRLTPNQVTVRSVYGKATATVSSSRRLSCGQRQCFAACRDRAAGEQVRLLRTE